MPWVRRPTASKVDRMRRRARRIAFDHSDAVTSVGIGSACVLATIIALRVAGFI